MSDNALLQNIELNDSPSGDEFEQFSTKFSQADPVYLLFLKTHNGGDGYLANDDYISLWTIEDIIDLNPYYDDDPFCDTVIIFGSNGSDTAYGMTKAGHSYFYAPYIGMSEEVTYVGTSFWEFLKIISR